MMCIYFVWPISSYFSYLFFLMIRRPPRSTLDRSSAASDVYKRQTDKVHYVGEPVAAVAASSRYIAEDALELIEVEYELSLIHISEPTRPY